MKSTEIILDICEKYGGEDKRQIMFMLLGLRKQIKAEVKAKLTIAVKNINKLYGR
jgi:hypothetical protein